jgi:hypothetical protein
VLCVGLIVFLNFVVGRSDAFDWDFVPEVELDITKEKDYPGAEVLREAGRQRRLEVVEQLWAERICRIAANTPL